MSSNTKKILIALGIGLVVVAVPATLAFLDMGKISTVEDEIAKFEKDSGELKKKQKELDTLRTGTRTEMVTFLRKRNSLPTGREADEFVDKLAEFRQKAGIPPWEISKTQTRQAAGRGATPEAAGSDAVEEYKYAIKMEARYHQLGHLLSQIEYWDRFIRVAAIKVTGGGKAEFKPATIRDHPTVQTGDAYKAIREGDADRKLEDYELEPIPDALRKEFGNVPLEVSLELVTYFYPEEKPQAAPVAPPKATKPAAKGAAPVVDPAEQAKLEAELIDEATVEAESGDVAGAKQKLDRFLWPVEENAGIRNPFNPLEALTPSKITIDTKDPRVVEEGSTPLSEAERPEVDARIHAEVGRMIRYVQERLEGAKGFLEAGTEPDLLDAIKYVEMIKAPAFEKKAPLDRADDILKNPYQLLVDIIAKRGTSIRDKLEYPKLAQDIQKVRTEVNAIEQQLDRRRVEIALALSRRVYEKMVEQLDKHQYKDVRTTFDKEMKPLAAKSSAVAGVREYVEKAAELDRKAAVRLEFFDLKMRMTAVVYDADNPEKSVFMIGGDHKARAVGELFELGKEKVPVRVMTLGASETVDETGGVISTYDLLVEYKGEKIPVRQLTHASQLLDELEHGGAVDGKPGDKKKGGK